VGALEASEFDCVSLDWTSDADELAALHRIKPHTLAFQGNLDPCALYASPANIRIQVICVCLCMCVRACVRACVRVRD
jgi:uroporphyrinogen-III decarboxylase